ncbi:MAG: hypothetical protein M1826_001030 [Phylliscum demangeonii]|nr:MAG: hypothetical protein M1826_001030 [Phylliscum demangeonii]
MTLAFNRLTAAAPTLPEAHSPLPALIALRAVDRAMRDTTRSLAAIDAQASEARSRLDDETTARREAAFITAALEARIRRLRESQRQRSERSARQTLDELVDRIQRRTEADNRGLKMLVKAFNDFMESHLAAMLAAEETGGPVIGVADEMDVDGGVDGETRSAAVADLRSLTEELLNASVSGGGYIELDRDSAASRFLVRARVAHLAPNDARRLRLADFGRQFSR